MSNLEIPLLGGGKNGHADPLMQAAQAQQAAEAQLQAVLQMTLQRPAESRRLNIALPAVVTEKGTKILYIALPTGERIELPLPKMVARALARELEKDASDEEEQEAA